jgi:hypothetical protein
MNIDIIERSLGVVVSELMNLRDMGVLTQADVKNISCMLHSKVDEIKFPRKR